VGDGVYLSAATFDGVLVEDTVFKNGWGSGVFLHTPTTETDPQNVASTPSTIRGISVIGCKHAVMTAGVGDVLITGCHSLNTTDTAFYDKLTRSTTVANCVVVGSGYHGICTLYSHGFIASGNQVNNSAGIGICVGGASETNLIPANGFAITGNTVRASTLSNIQIDTTLANALTTPQDTYGAVTGNHSTGSGVHGFYLHNAQYLTVTGNVSRGNIGTGIALDSAYVTLDGNIAVGNNGYGIAFFGDVAGYGHHAPGRNISRGNALDDYYYGVTGATDTTLQLSGAGTPEAVVAAPIGSTYMRTDGGPTTTLYVKTSGGVTNTGWTAK
jgi:parallel beta-helix repeat protein